MAEKASRKEQIQQLRISLGISETTPAHIQLRRMREGRGYTREKLAEKLSEEMPKPTDPNTIRRWETNEHTPELPSRKKLWDLFGIPIYAWIEGDKQKKGNFSQSSDASLQEISPQEKLLSPVWYVPYDRNTYFIDQRNLVYSLHQRLTAKEIGTTRLAISGLGGIGKTQLALAYAYQYRNEYTAVLWIGASTESRMFQDFAHIGQKLQLPETRKASPQHRYIVNEVLHWLHTTVGWLLILDNVEEGIDDDIKDAVTEEKALTLEALLKISDTGHMIFTTRSQTLARHAQNVFLEEMRLEEGTQLLLLQDGQSPSSQNMENDVHREEARALCELLGGLPLALEQARAYIEATKCGFIGYRDLYETSRKELLQSVARGSRLEREYKESVATTWLISFRHVEQQFAVASDVLKFYAYIAPDAIPEDLLLKGAEKLEGSLHLLAGNRFQFNRVCEVLLNYSLIKRDADEALLSIHQLIQAVLQDHLDDEAQRHWAEQAVRAVEHALYNATELELERYISHAQVCAQFIERYHLEGEEAAFLLKMAAKAIDEQGWYAQAQPLYVQALNAYTHSFGPDDLRTIHLLLDVLNIHLDMGASSFAADGYSKAIADVERVLGPDHPEVLSLLNNVTWALFACKDYQGATHRIIQALQLLERISTIADTERAKTYQIAAELFVLLGKAEIAESFYQEAKVLFEQTLEYRELANTLVNWGSFRAFRGDLEQGEKYLRRALKIREDTLGRDHPETADSLVALAGIVWQSARYEEVEEYYQRALAIRRQKLGEYHPDVLHILRNLAELAIVQKKDDVAEKYFREALDFAPLHSEYASEEYRFTVEAYADYLRKQGRTEEADNLQ